MDLERNELIYNLYFKDKLTVSEISKKVNLSISQIRNYEEKKNKKQMEEKAIMDKLHRQAAIELSYFSYMSKVALRKNCSSAYYYNSKKKRFELKQVV